jgi:hypothetical protein
MPVPTCSLSLKKKLSGKTTSKAERVMKRANARANVGKWSVAGAFNVAEVRLAHCYNGFDA